MNKHSNELNDLTNNMCSLIDQAIMMGRIMQVYKTPNYTLNECIKLENKIRAEYCLEPVKARA